MSESFCTCPPSALTTIFKHIIFRTELIAYLKFIPDGNMEQAENHLENTGRTIRPDYLSLKTSTLPIASTSISVFLKQRIASSGLHTIGSSITLNEVLITKGQPVSA